MWPFSMDVLFHDFKNRCYITWSHFFIITLHIWSMCRMKKQINVNGSNDLVVKSLDSQSRGPVFKTVSRQLLHEENCPRLGLGFGSRLGLVLGLQGNQTIALRKIAPWLGFGLGLVLGDGGNFPRGQLS